MFEEYLTRKRFIAALVREYRAAYGKRDKLALGNAGYLEIEIQPSTDSYRLLMRGNEHASHWYILKTKHLCTVEGLKAAHQVASDIMFEAVQELSEILDVPVSIGIRPVSFFHGWFTEATKTN